MHLTRLASLHRLDSDTSLLVNGLSGAVDRVDNALSAKLCELRRGGRPALEEQHRALLIQRAYLFPDEEGEQAALAEVRGAYQRFAASRPLQFVVCPTYSCNLACTYCFESTDLRARPEVMTARQVDHLFAALRRMAAEQSGRQCQIVLFGGEPLLPITKGAVEKIVTAAAQEGYPVSIATNGTHLPRFAALLRDHPGVVRGAQITLDGPEAVHNARRKHADDRGSFAEVMRGVEMCFEVGLEVNLRVNLDAQNVGSLEELTQLFEERGWSGRDGFRCQLAPVTDHLGTSSYPFMMREDALVEPVLEFQRRRPELLNVLDFQLFRVLQHLLTTVERRDRRSTMPRFHYCEADRGDVVTFGPDGLIYVCPESLGVPENAIGAYSPRYRLRPDRVKRWERRSVLDLPECQQCDIATFCGGGCAYAALQQRGSPAHGICGDAPEVVKAYMGMLRKRLQSGETVFSEPPSAQSRGGPSAAPPS